MILHDASLHGEPGSWNIYIKDGRIGNISKNDHTWIAEEPGEVLNLNGALALPGFINSHDHLDFNLFPQLGTKTYPNYRQWGPEIQKINRELIASILKIPKDLRIRWGIYKNLLNGFTSVVNHGEHLNIDSDLLTIYQNACSLHSVGFEKRWKWKLNNPFLIKTPIVMHLGEGTDDSAHTEIDQVIKANLFKRKIIAVHGVAMSEKQAGQFKGLVWCPASNYFLLNKTADVNILKSKVPVVFGTDSTLTSPWNAWEHFRLALKTKMADENELLKMLTEKPASLWGMKDRGSIAKNQKADIIILKNKETLFDHNPEDLLLVLVNGEIKLIDERLDHKYDLKEFTDAAVKNSMKKIRGDLNDLTNKIKKYLPDTCLY